jgi:hypothetical protein
VSEGRPVSGTVAEAGLVDHREPRRGLRQRSDMVQLGRVRR